MRRRHNVRAIVYDIIDGNLYFLILKARKGYWQNIQGGVDEGEDTIHATIREIREESGLENVLVHEETETGMEYDAVRKGEPVHISLTAYAVRADARDLIYLSDEGHTDSKWVTKGEAYNFLNAYPEQQIVFQNVYHRLQTVLTKR